MLEQEVMSTDIKFKMPEFAMCIGFPLTYAESKGHSKRVAWIIRHINSNLGNGKRHPACRIPTARGTLTLGAQSIGGIMYISDLLAIYASVSYGDPLSLQMLVDIGLWNWHHFGMDPYDCSTNYEVNGRWIYGYTRDDTPYNPTYIVACQGSGITEITVPALIPGHQKLKPEDFRRRYLVHHTNGYAVKLIMTAGGKNNGCRTSPRSPRAFMCGLVINVKDSGAAQGCRAGKQYKIVLDTNMLCEIVPVQFRRKFEEDLEISWCEYYGAYITAQSSVSFYGHDGDIHVPIRFVLQIIEVERGLNIYKPPTLRTDAMFASVQTAGEQVTCVSTFCNEAAPNKYFQYCVTCGAALQSADGKIIPDQGHFRQSCRYAGYTEETITQMQVNTFRNKTSLKDSIEQTDITILDATQHKKYERRVFARANLGRKRYEKAAECVKRSQRARQMDIANTYQSPAVTEFVEAGTKCWCYAHRWDHETDFRWKLYVSGRGRVIQYHDPDGNLVTLEQAYLDRYPESPITMEEAVMLATEGSHVPDSTSKAYQQFQADDVQNLRIGDKDGPCPIDLAMQLDHAYMQAKQDPAKQTDQSNKKRRMKRKLRRK